MRWIWITVFYSGPDLIRRAVGLLLLHVGEAHEAKGEHAAFKEFSEDGEEAPDGHFEGAEVGGWDSPC